MWFFVNIQIFFGNKTDKPHRIRNSMTILHVGNTANIGYYTTKQLRKYGIDCNLLFEPTGNFDDPLKADPSLNNQYPNWFVTYHRKQLFWKLKILKTMWKPKYDLIHAYFELPMFANFSNKPLVIQLLGTEFRKTAISNTRQGKLLRRAYRKAKVLLFSMPDHFPIYKKLGLKNGIFFPLLVDSNFYKPLEVERKNDDDRKFTILHPTNLDWNVKGNDILIKGFADFVKNNPNALLIIIERGSDSEKTRELISSLGITQNVKFIKGPIFSPELLNYYNKVDVVADAFRLPAVSGTTNESMCCEKPVICYYPKEEFEGIYSEHPPILNASNPVEVQTQLEILMNDSKRREIGRKGREWILKYNNPDLYVKKLQIIYESVLIGDEIDEIKKKLRKIMVLKEIN